MFLSLDQSLHSTVIGDFLASQFLSNEPRCELNAGENQMNISLRSIPGVSAIFLDKNLYT